MPEPATFVSAHRKTAIVATLRKSRMFTDLSSADLDAIAHGCSLRTLDKGETLFREGEKAHGFYVAQSGRISIFRLTPDGREQIICVFSAPESFAEATLATVETYPANAQALEPSQVILVHKKPFRYLLSKKPELALLMLSSMSLHLKHLVQSLQDMKGRQIENRLASWLMEHVPIPHSGSATPGYELPITKKVLAGQLGVTSETLSRTFARFKREELLRVSGPLVEILNEAGLRAYMEI